MSWREKLYFTQLLRTFTESTIKRRVNHHQFDTLYTLCSEWLWISAALWRWVSEVQLLSEKLAKETYECPNKERCHDNSVGPQPWKLIHKYTQYICCKHILWMWENGQSILLILNVFTELLFVFFHPASRSGGSLSSGDLVRQPPPLAHTPSWARFLLLRVSHKKDCGTDWSLKHPPVTIFFSMQWQICYVETGRSKSLPINNKCISLEAVVQCLINSLSLIFMSKQYSIVFMLLVVAWR